MERDFMNEFPYTDLSQMARWCRWRRVSTGWIGEGHGPVGRVPPDFRLLQARFAGDDERCWVSLTRRVLLIEAPGGDRDLQVSLETFQTWESFISRVLDEFTADQLPSLAAALLAAWWADPRSG
jgi:hypothetical protein